jgi:hypothetical protein
MADYSQMVSDYDPNAVLPPPIEDDEEEAKRRAAEPAGVRRVGDTPLPPKPPPARDIRGLPSSPGLPLLPEPTKPVVVAPKETNPVTGDPIAKSEAVPYRSSAPINVSRNLPPMPMRSDPRYQYPGGLKNRLGAGLTEMGVASQLPTSNSPDHPGVEMGQSLGHLLGGFIGGVARPQSAYNARYQTDLGRWQQQQEAASKAATEEEARRAQEMHYTGLDVDTGKPLLPIQINRDYKQSQIDKNAAYEKYLDIHGQTLMGNLSERHQKNLTDILKSGVLRPDAEMEAVLEQNHWKYIPPAAKGQYGQLQTQVRDPETGVIKTHYYVLDKATQTLKPVKMGGEIVTGGADIPFQATNPPNASSQRLDMPPLPDKPDFTSTTGGNPFGGFSTRNAVIAAHHGMGSQWEAATREIQRAQAAADGEQQKLKDYMEEQEIEPVLDNKGKQKVVDGQLQWKNTGRMQARSHGDTDKEQARFEKQADYLQDKVDAAKKSVEAATRQRDAIEAEVHKQFDTIPGHHWRGPGEGFYLDEKELKAPSGTGGGAQVKDYPLGNKVRDTGKLPRQQGANP